MAIPSVLNLVPKSLPYPISGGIIRGIRVGIAYLLAGVVASIGDGSLLNTVKVVPPEYHVFVQGALTVAMVSVDKWLRERGLIDKAAEEEAGLSLVDDPTPPSVVDVPDPVVNVKQEVTAVESVAVPVTDDVPTDGPITDGDSENPTEFDDPVDNV